jgi:hypothetical protein
VTYLPAKRKRERMNVRVVEKRESAAHTIDCAHAAPDLLQAVYELVNDLTCALHKPCPKWCKATGDVSTGTALELAERAVAKATRAEGAVAQPKGD